MATDDKGRAMKGPKILRVFAWYVRCRTGFRPDLCRVSPEIDPPAGLLDLPWVSFRPTLGQKLAAEARKINSRAAPWRQTIAARLYSSTRCWSALLGLYWGSTGEVAGGGFVADREVERGGLRFSFSARPSRWGERALFTFEGREAAPQR